MLKGIQNFLELVNENWTTIAVIIGLCLTIAKKVMEFVGHTNEERIVIAKQQIKETILKMILDAELDFNDWNKAGSIKRSQVIGMIYEKYPILSKAVNQNDLIAWIDMEINESLKTLKEVVENNKVE